MVVSETNGTWGTAEVVPGSVALNTGFAAQIDSVSCASPGNCSAAGEDSTRAAKAEPLHPFLVSEDNGTWGTAISPLGLNVLSKGGGAEVNAVSCATADNCAAGGNFANAPHGSQAFTVSETTTPTP